MVGNVYIVLLITADARAIVETGGTMLNTAALFSTTLTTVLDELYALTTSNGASSTLNGKIVRHGLLNFDGLRLLGIIGLY